MSVHTDLRMRIEKVEAKFEAARCAISTCTTLLVNTDSVRTRLHQAHEDGVPPQGQSTYSTDRQESIYDMALRYRDNLIEIPKKVFELTQLYRVAMRKVNAPRRH